ncbi:MAG: DUF5076 domain-containing protein [Sphingomonas sp.]
MTEPVNSIPLAGVKVLSDKSVEIARLWVTNGGGSTVFIDARRMPDAGMFGMLLADTANHAANAYAAALGIPHEEALKRVWDGMDGERNNPSGSMELTDPFGKQD